MDSFLESSNTPEETKRPKPYYLAFLRFFGGANLVVAIIASFVFVLNVIGEMRRDYGAASLAWLVALAVAIQGFVSYGVLNAFADIAENMIEVGRYIRAKDKE